MSTVLIRNKNLYKLYKDLPYNFHTAIFHLMDCFIKKANKEKAYIKFHVNIKEQWLQIISENNLFDINEKELIWEHDLNIGTFDWKYPIFYLGETVSIEIKNNQSAIMSQISLNASDDEIEISNIDRNKILSKYNVATRLSIINLNYKITEDLVRSLVKKISFIYRDKILSNLLDIHFLIIDNDCMYQFVNEEIVQVKNDKDLLLIKQCNDNKYRVIKTELLYQNKNYLIECELTKGDSFSLCLSNKTRVINELPILNNVLFNSMFKFNINVRILNLKLNLYRTDFNWQLLSFDTLINHVSNVVSADLNKDTKSLESEKINNQFSAVELENLKNLLTKSFDGLSSTNKFDNFEIKKDKLKFSYHADDNKQITINLIKTKQKNFEHEWLQLEPVREEHIEQNYEYNVLFNYAHPFFNYFLKDKDDANKIEQLIICYAIAETICRLEGNDVTQLKYEINKLLRGT